MRKIKQEVSLQGILETITASELRKQPGEVLDSVALGKAYVVTKQGKPIAIISAPPGQTLTIQARSDGELTYRI